MMKVMVRMIVGSELEMIRISGREVDAECVEQKWSDNAGGHFNQIRRKLSDGDDVDGEVKVGNE